MSVTVECPTCGRLVAWNERSPWRPFCSERCKLIDLGEWIAERHRIPGDDMQAGEPRYDGDGDDEPPDRQGQ